MRTLANAILALFGSLVCASASEFSRPWLDSQSTLILDPYQANALDFSKLSSDPKVAAIIHKASAGLAQDDAYLSRRNEALQRGYLWGSYHLFTTADVNTQIDRYLDFVGIHPDETYALDVECLSSSGDCQRAQYKVSVASIELALRRFKDRTGNFPLVYSNGSVTAVLAPAFASTPEFASVKLWYARFKGDISSYFPNANWKSYTLWQFSSELNCKPAPGSCPYRVPGTAHDMDVNVFNGSPDALKESWPLNR